jgi:hypothetical protein
MLIPTEKPTELYTQNNNNNINQDTILYTCNRNNRKFTFESSKKKFNSKNNKNVGKIIDINLSNNMRNNFKKFQKFKEESREQLRSTIYLLDLNRHKLNACPSSRNITHESVQSLIKPNTGLSNSKTPLQLSMREDIQRTINILLQKINRGNDIISPLTNHNTKYVNKKDNLKQGYNIKKIDKKYYIDKLNYLTKDIWNQSIAREKKESTSSGLPYLKIPKKLIAGPSYSENNTERLRNNALRNKG